MSTNSPSREVSHDPRDTKQAPRKSSRLRNKDKERKQTSRGSVSSKESKAPRIIKSSSSSEKSKLATLRTPKRGSPKTNDDSDDSKSNASSKMSFWGSPDLSVGVENLLKLIKLNGDSKELIISLNVCTVKNMIQLSDQDIDDVTNLFSRQDLRNPNFQDAIIKVLCLGKCFKLLIKEKHGFENDEVPEKLIPSTFSEENAFLDPDNMVILKRHYVKYYLPLRKELLDYLEDLMTQDSLIGSTVSTRSKKMGSNVSRMSSPSVKSTDTKSSHASSISKPTDFYPKHLNHAFMPTPDFDGDRRAAKQQYESSRVQFEDNPEYLNEELHQMPDDPNTFMNMIKGRAMARTTANDERRQVLNPRVIWDGSIDRFEVFRNNVEGHYGQIGAGYLFDPEFQVAYLDRGTECYIDFLDEVPSASQIKKDTRALYGALLSACQGGVGRRILMENRIKQDGIRSWYQLVNQYETESNRNVRIKKLENVITNVFQRNFRGGLFKWIQDYEDAFTELVLLGQKAWEDDDSKKRRMVQNAQNIGMVDTVFEELVRNKTFIETCNFLRSHAIRHDQQNKERIARQINAANQAHKKDKVKQVLALINELQIQDSNGSDEELEVPPSSKTAMVCKLAQIPPEIWMTLPLEAKKWLLNERKRQQQEDDKLKKSSNPISKDHDKFKSSGQSGSNSSSHTNMPNQYAKVKNAVKGEEDIQDQTTDTYGFVDEFLEDAIKSSNLYEEQDANYETWNSEHNIYASISINNTLYNQCMSLLLLPEKRHISILDGGADTCVLGKGWEILSIHNSRRANVVGFDHETAIKKNLPIVSAITTVDLPNGESILLIINEGIYNETANHSLLSEFQLREFGVIIDSVCQRHGGTQQMKIVNDNNHDEVIVPLDLAGCMVHFKHRLPTKEEFTSLKQFCLTQGETAWNPSSFSDQVADEFYKQVIDTESYNANSLKLFPYDPTDEQHNNLVGKPATITFSLNTVMKAHVTHTASMDTDLHYSKALPSKIDYERLSPYFAFRPHDVIQNTLRQTTQLAKSTIHYPMRRHLKSRFQMLRHKRLNEVIATDTYFASDKSIEGYYCAQVFFGMTSKSLFVAGMKTESEFPDVYLDFIRQNGIPSALRRDNAKSEMSQRVKNIHRDLVIADQWTEPHSPWQNPAELNGVKYLKSHAQVLLDRTGAPDSMWFLAQDYLAHVHNLSANRQINWQIPQQVSRGGTPDISHILMFYWFEPVLYLDPVAKFPETTERPGYFVGFADNVGDVLTFKILKNDLSTVLHRSVVRSAADPGHLNKRVTFKSDVQETLDKLDTRPSVLFPRNIESKQRSRKPNDDISTRTRSKAGPYIDQNVGNRTRSKVHGVHNSDIQGDFFPLYDAVSFQNKSNISNNIEVVLQLGVTECNAYQTTLMNPKSQSQLEHLRQLHMLDKVEDDKSWECVKMLKYSEEKDLDNSVQHKCLVEWNDLNKSQSWVNFFALCLSDPTPVISFAREHKLLDKRPFCHLIPYCKVKPPLDIAKIHKVTSSPTTVKYKFGIQVPKGIKNAISLDKKNNNNLWQEAIETELKQLTDYETFIILDSGEDIPKGYQKIPYHIVFDVKYDLRHKARLVAGGNWTVNDKEDIYSGVVRMDTIRIGFFLGELYGLSCCACDIGNAFLYGKTKEKVYITAGPEFGSTLFGKNLIINKSLYGLKTSAARFHEHLAESLLRLGFKKTKHDPDLWMVDKVSHYEYLATYVDDILIWSKDPMAVIKSLEKIYLLKNVGIPEYYLGGNVEFLGETWKNQGLGLAISAKTYIQNVIPKFEGLFGKELKPIKTPMSEGYHPEVDDSPLCTEEDSAKYRSVIGCCIWIILLGRFDIAYATSAMSRFNMAPREGHLKAVKRILAYLKTFPKGRVIIDTSYPNHSEYPVEDHSNWKDFYPDAEEETPNDLPMSKGPKVRMTVYVDADHAHDLVTRRSITGILVMLNNTPIRWVSKRQKTVETSTYGSELVAARIATELIMEVRYMLRSLGVSLEGPTLMLGDNMSVVLNTSVPSSVLKKKHNAIAYHRVREAIAARVLRFAYLKSEENVSDILTKPLCNEKFHYLVKKWLFRTP